jgi:hypothetical protein
MRTSLRKYFFFLFLLPVFFVLHGFNEHYDFIPVRDALFLTLIYLFSSLLLLLIFWLWYRNFIKASLAAFSAMGIHLFFGSFHDLLKNIFPGSLLSKYSFILTLLFLFFFTFLFVLKKKKKNPEKTCLYLNLLFFVLIIAELGFLGGKIISGRADTPQLPEGFTFCNNCPRPDIYFILADEYAGNTELKDMFGFDNSDFTNELTKRGFHVIQDSYTNYNYTPFAVGSILDMGYIDLPENHRGAQSLTISYNVIKNNRLLQFLQYHKYDFFNLSIFDFAGQPAPIHKGLIPVKTRLITSQTLISRLNRDLRFHIITRLKSRKELIKWTYSTLKNNELIYDATLKLAEKETSSPKFIYSHLELPHYPYYFDKTGKQQPFEKLTEDNQVDKKGYLEYLQYGNKKLLKLIDHIIQNSAKPPIIILMGDHGFRHFTEKVENKYHFLNLCTIYTPEKNYREFKDSLAGVNFFRALLNQNFGQKLNYLKDSTIYMNY